MAAKLAQLEAVLKDYTIEVAEARASDKQRAFQEDFFARRHRTYAALGGNRSGKSVVTGKLCACKWIRDVARDGSLVWCVSPTSEKSVGGPQKVFWETLPRAMFGKVSWDAKNGFDGNRPIITLELPGGRGHCVVNFKNSEQSYSTFEQDAIDLAWADESLPHEVYSRLIPRTIDRRGIILISDIPEQAWHWFDLAKARPAQKVYCQVFAMHDNQANLPEGEIELAAARMSKEESDMRIWGKFRRLTGVVFREYDQLRHRIRPFGIPSEGPYPSLTNWPRWRLLDIGGSAPTACVWATLAPNEKAYIYRLYYQPFGNVKSHAHAIKEMSVGADGRPEEYVANLIDPAAWHTSAANEVTVADQYALEGLAFSPWPATNVFGQKAEVEIVKRRLEVEQLVVFDTLEELDREFSSWKYQTDAEGMPLASDLYEKKNNHALSCIMAWLATRPTFTVPGIKVHGRRQEAPEGERER